MKNNNYPYYAIQINGRRNNIYQIREVVAHGVTNPFNGVAYKTLEEAQARADKLGIRIEKIGSSYEII